MRKKLIRYYPPVLQQVLEFNYISASMDSQLDQADAAGLQCVHTRFIDLADEDGISHLEKVYSVIPKATDTLDDRRFRLRVKLMQYPPFTLRWLERALTFLCGANGYALSIDYDKYYLSLMIRLSAIEAYNDVSDMLGRVLPANIVLKLGIDYNRYLKYGQKYKHNQMSPYTQGELRTKEIHLEGVD